MKVLVTGGAGYIGSHTCVELLNANIDIIVVDDFSNSDIKALESIKKITKKDFKFYELNILDEEKFEKVFKENDIDAVIHFAAFKAVGESVEKPLDYYLNNVTGTLKLLKLMKKYNVNNFVFSSSATVYGKPKKLPLTEDMELSTTNPYGATKLMVEQILKDVSISDKNLKVGILRYFNPIGAHDSKLIGEKPNGIPNNLMPYISKVATGKLEKLKVFGSDYDTKDGTGVRDYIHVVDLAIAHIKILNKIIDEKTGIFIYNVGTGTGYSVLEMINTFEKVNNVKVNYEIVERRKGDIAACYADPTKAFNELGFKTTKTLEDMVRDSWNFESNL